MMVFEDRKMRCDYVLRTLDIRNQRNREIWLKIWGVTKIP